MSLQNISGSFRTAPGTGGQNCGDGVSFGGVNAVWTGGDTLIDSLGPIGINPLANPAWTLLSVSIAALLQGTLSMVGGKLGKIYAGIVREASPTHGASNSIDQRYALPLPADTTLISSLWDPDINPFPPNASANQITFNPSVPASLQVACQVSPPQPITIDPNVPLGIGIWLEPALICSLGSGAQYLLSVLNAVYSLTYDDGLPG